MGTLGETLHDSDSQRIMEALAEFSDRTVGASDVLTVLANWRPCP